MLNALWNWILANPAEAGGILTVVVTVALVLVRTLQAKGTIREALLQAMLRFERERRHGKLGPIDGPQIMTMVITWAMNNLVPRLPFWLRPAITPERIEMMAQALYNGIFDLLDDGQLNGTTPQFEDDPPQPAA